MDEVIYLEITSFVGMSIGARHYYGTLEGDYVDNVRHSVTLEYELTQVQATKLNAEDAKYGSTLFIHRAGHKYVGFNSKDEIVKLAIYTWRQHFPQGQILVQGRHAVADPQPILDCNNQADYEYLNHIYKLFEAAGGWGSKANDRIVQPIWDLWNNKFSQYSGIKYT